jgi:hypothetical protein
MPSDTLKLSSFPQRGVDQWAVSPIASSASRLNELSPVRRGRPLDLSASRECWYTDEVSTMPRSRCEVSYA